MIVLDIETNLAHDTIWCAVTYSEDDGFKVWTEDNNAFFQEYLNSNAPVVMHNGIGFPVTIATHHHLSIAVPMP